MHLCPLPPNSQIQCPRAKTLHVALQGVYILDGAMILRDIIMIYIP
jgi:hypothetical protein